MLLDRSIDWTDHPWVWPAEHSKANSYVWFTLDVNLAGDAETAWLAITASGPYQIWINAHCVHAGPCREVPPFARYDCLDLRAHLQSGHNRIRILAHHAGIDHQSAQATAPGLLCTGALQAGDQVISLAMPGDWCCQRETAYQPSWRLGGCLGWAEHYVPAQASDPGTHGAITGTAPSVVGRHPWVPFTTLIPRRYPQLTGDTITATLLRTTPAGRLYDFGREVSGQIHIAWQASQTARCDVRYAEKLVEGAFPPEHPGMDYRDRLCLTPGNANWRSFDARAGRYLLISDPAINITIVQVHERHYPYPAPRLPATEPDRRLCAISAATITRCSSDLLEDCPWREKAQYLDPYAYIGAMQALFNDLTPIRTWLLQLARGCIDRGRLPMCYPSPPGKTVIPDFMAVFVMAIERYIRLSGDRSLLPELLPAARITVDDLTSMLGSDGLIVAVPGWLFLDNCFQLPRHPCSAGMNAVYAGALRAMITLCRLADDGDQAGVWQQHYDAMRSAFRAAFVHERGVRDHLGNELAGEWWNHHANAAGLPGSSGTCWLRSRLGNTEGAERHLHIAHFSDCRVFIDGTCVYQAAQHGNRIMPPLDDPRPINIPLPAQAELMIEYAYSGYDWEVFLHSDKAICWETVEMAQAPIFGEAPPSMSAWETTRWRPYERARMSQVTVGLAAEHGMLTDAEARRFLADCLPETYHEPWRKRTTPFFVSVTDDRETLKRTVLPANTPWALYPFCQALSRYGMGPEARSLIHRIYGHMLDQGATSWWEEWGPNSSHCHAWGAFIAEFLLEQPDPH